MHLGLSTNKDQEAVNEHTNQQNHKPITYHKINNQREVPLNNHPEKLYRQLKHQLCQITHSIPECNEH